MIWRYSISLRYQEKHWNLLWSISVAAVKNWSQVWKGIFCIIQFKYVKENGQRSVVSNLTHVSDVLKKWFHFWGSYEYDLWLRLLADFQCFNLQMGLNQSWASRVLTQVWSMRWVFEAWYLKWAKLEPKKYELRLSSVDSWNSTK